MKYSAWLRPFVILYANSQYLNTKQNFLKKQDRQIFLLQKLLLDSDIIYIEEIYLVNWATQIKQPRFKYLKNLV